MSKDTDENHRKLSAEQHVQSDQVEHHPTAIQSRTIRSIGRTTTQSSYLDIMQQCYTCKEIYSLTRNLVPHVKGKNTVVEYWNCTEF